MAFATNLLLDVPFPIRMKGGDIAHMPLADALAHKDSEAVSSGHPYIDALATNFTICALQTLMMQPDTDGWRALLRKAPSAEEIRQSFSVHAHCFDLSDPNYPFMQVRFNDTEEAKGKKPPKLAIEPSEEDGEFDEPSDGQSGLSNLLPDESTTNQRKRSKSGEHFTKRNRFANFGAFAAGMLLYGVNLIGIGGGGGYFNPGTKSAAFARLSMPDFPGMEHAMWKSAWANVATADYPALSALEDSSGLVEALYGWMSPNVRRTRNKSKAQDEAQQKITSEGKTQTSEGLVSLHPLYFMWGLSRRCELAAEREGICSLTGISGPVWNNVEVQPGGPRTPLLRFSWHPLLGVRTNKSKEKTPGVPKMEINKGPKTGVFTSMEWSAFFPPRDSGASASDLEEKGVPASIAMLSMSGRRDALNRILRNATGTGLESPTLPIMALAIRQDKVLEGWSEGSLRLWTGDREVLGNIAVVLASLQAGAASATAVITAAADAAEKRAPKNRSGPDAKGFKSQLISNMLASVQNQHDEIGNAALDDVSSLEAATDDDGIAEAIDVFVGELKAQLSSSCLAVVETTDFSLLGGPLVHAAAVLAAKTTSKARLKKENPAKK